MDKKKIELVMSVVLILAAILVSARGTIFTGSSSAKAKERVIVIDAGHGGTDPGKIGINKAKEKDINLIIAKKLKKLLEKEGIRVVMVREDDNGLYRQESESKKVEDMRNRCTLIDEAEPICTISVHQNSYHEEEIKGAQVFYYEHSKDGKEIAEYLQQSLVDGLDRSNRRQAKANDSYYLLRKTKNPTIIVECGFLSNWEEAELLVTDKYQKKVAKAICAGIMKYLEDTKQ